MNELNKRNRKLLSRAKAYVKAAEEGEKLRNDKDADVHIRVDT